jgi:hypothetical protein
VATQTKSNPITDSVETATERLSELNEKAVENGRKAGAAYLSSYEKAAGATRLDWVTTFATAQADFTREVTKAYTSAARDLVS